MDDAASSGTTTAPEPQAGLGEWFSRFSLQSATGWSSSMIVHLVLLILLALWSLPGAFEQPPPQVVATINDRPQELVNQTLDENLDAATEISFVSSSAAMVGLQGSAPVAEPQIDRELVEADTGLKITPGDLTVWSSRGESLARDMPDGTFGDPQAVVGDYAQAMDRITREILMLLSTSKVLVIWCFDESESMVDDQQEIKDRIERVYEELGLSKTSQGDALLTAVTSFGSGYKVHTRQPTADFDAIRKAIDAVPVDESGEEMTCLAVGKAIQDFRKFATSGRRKLALILVTDESGDRETNSQFLEPAIAEAKGARCNVYVLGREAVFGYPYARIRWQDPKTKLRFWLRIDRGPETPFAEQLQIDGYNRRQDAHPSGFGPYEQVRLARETGGIFFLLPSIETNLVLGGARTGRGSNVARGVDRKFELEAMRPYMPDLSPRAEYARERGQSQLRTYLWKVITDLNPYDTSRDDDVVLRTRFAVNPAQFTEQAKTNVRTAQGLIRYYEQAATAFENIRDQRNQEADPRWQANYDLLYAQIVAFKVRAIEYAEYVEAFVKTPKTITNPLGPTKKTNFWEIRTRKKTLTGDRVADDIARAEKMLRAVMKDHAGTPWATRAQIELRRGFGVELVEYYLDPRSSSVKRPNL